MADEFAYAMQGAPSAQATVSQSPWSARGSASQTSLSSHLGPSLWPNEQEGGSAVPPAALSSPLAVLATDEHAAATCSDARRQVLSHWAAGGLSRSANAAHDASSNGAAGSPSSVAGPGAEDDGPAHSDPSIAADDAPQEGDGWANTGSEGLAAATAVAEGALHLGGWDLGGWTQFAMSLSTGGLGAVAADRLSDVTAAAGRIGIGKLPRSPTALGGEGIKRHGGGPSHGHSGHAQSQSTGEGGQATTDHANPSDAPVVPQGGGGSAEPGDVVSGYVIYAAEVRHGGSLAWRNNNPGNIRPGSFTRAHGAFAGKSNHGFAIFPTYEQGFAAIVALLHTGSYQKKTILQAMQSYAPAGDHNDPVSYAQSIQRLTGLETSRKVASLSEAELAQMASAIQRVEGYTAGRILQRDDPSLPTAVRQALGQSSPGNASGEVAAYPSAQARGSVSDGNVHGQPPGAAASYSHRKTSAQGQASSKQSSPNSNAGRTPGSGQDTAHAQPVPNDGSLRNVKSGVTMTASIAAGYAVLLPYLPASVWLTSGLRTDEQQRQLIQRMYKKNGGPAGVEDANGQHAWLVQKGFKVARVGGSKHRTGLAFDLSGAPLTQIREKVQRCAEEHPDSFFLSRTIVEVKNNCLHVELTK